LEAERTTKTLVQGHLRIVPTPAPLRASLQNIVQTKVYSTPALLEWLRELLWDSRTLRLAIALGVVAIVLTTLILQPLPPGTPTALPPDDVLVHSRTTYAAIVDGTVRPQIETTEPSELASFFAGKTDFPLYVPPVRDYHPVGATFDSQSGVPLAHLMYAGAGGTVYIHQTCWETVQAGQLLCLSERIRDSLRSRGFYADENDTERSVVLWTNGRTLCIAISSMSSQDLADHLSIAGQTQLP
jgi:hypothetical protein